MKKFLALLLASMMVLASVAAIADGASSPSVPTVVITTPAAVFAGTGILVSTDDPAVAAALAKVAAAGVYDAVDAETADALKAIFGDAEVEVNEAFAILGFGPSGEVELTITTPTPYAADKKVALVIKVVGEELVVEGTANTAGAVVVKLDADTVAKIRAAAKPVVLIVNEK